MSSTCLSRLPAFLKINSKIKSSNLKKLDDVSNQPRLSELSLDHRHSVAGIADEAIDDRRVWSAHQDGGFRSTGLRKRFKKETGLKKQT